MKKVIIALVFGYVGFCCALYVMQDGLLFHPRPNDPESVAALSGNEWQLIDEEGALRGWHIAGTLARAAPLVIYFGGNAQDVAHQAVNLRARALADANFLIVNYRGYGSSTGTPGEREFCADALRIFDAARALPHNGRVLAWGRSLGSGVATFLAAHRELAGVILVTPFDSLRAVAGNAYPWLPVHWLMRHPFDSATLAPTINTPAIALIADADRVIPASHAEALLAQWAGPSDTLRIDGVAHETIQNDPRFYPRVEEFIRSFGSGAER